MSDDTPSRPPLGRLARGLKLLGHLTSPETRSGQVFTQVEQRLTKLASRAAESPSWLRLTGSLMRQNLQGRIRRQALVERLLHTLRLPTASEVDALREQLHRANDQVEALGSQLEHVVELLERQQRQGSQLEDAVEEPRPREPARRKRGS